jgi:hypothetical protein
LASDGNFETIATSKRPSIARHQDEHDDGRDEQLDSEGKMKSGQRR